MASPQGTGAKRARPSATLPPISVARLKEVTLLIERMVAENTDVFVAAGQAYRARHRDGTSRPLEADEIAVLAQAMGTTLADAKTQIDDAGLHHHDEPAQPEVLLAAGVATAPAFMDAAMAVVALLEMPDSDFQAAREAGTLQHAIDEALPAIEQTGIKAARQRATAALAHLAAETEVDPGKAWGLVGRSVWQALQQAMSHLTIPDPEAISLSASSTPSPASTDGTAGPSSTTPVGPTPGS